jgi:hypothetical protein
MLHEAGCQLIRNGWLVGVSSPFHSLTSSSQFSISEIAWLRQLGAIFMILGRFAGSQRL